MSITRQSSPPLSGRSGSLPRFVRHGRGPARPARDQHPRRPTRPTTHRTPERPAQPTAPLPGGASAPPIFEAVGPPPEALAGFWRRLVAAFLDWLLVGIVAAPSASCSASKPRRRPRPAALMSNLVRAPVLPRVLLDAVGPAQADLARHRRQQPGRQDHLVPARRVRPPRSLRGMFPVHGDGLMRWITGQGSTTSSRSWSRLPRVAVSPRPRRPCLAAGTAGGDLGDHRGPHHRTADRQPRRADLALLGPHLTG